MIIFIYMIISSGKYFAYDGFLAKKVRLYGSQIMLNPTVKWILYCKMDHN